ncbi:MAG: hypothetical protein Fur0015_05430 [Ignavibacteriales bacterium]
MNKIKWLINSSVFILAVSMFTVGCGGVDEAQLAQLESLRAEVKSLEKESNSLKSEKTKLEREIAEQQAKLDQCNKEKAEKKANLEKIGK